MAGRPVTTGHAPGGLKVGRFTRHRGGGTGILNSGCTDNLLIRLNKAAGRGEEGREDGDGGRPGSKRVDQLMRRRPQGSITVSPRAPSTMQ